MSFQSVHDMLVPPGQVRKQKFWDFFDGDSLRSWWTEADGAGTGSGAMADEVDGGYQLTTGTSDNNWRRLTFDDLARHYEPTGSVFIIICNRDSTLSRFFAGLINPKNAANQTILVDNDTDNTFYELATVDGSTTNAVATSVTVDTTVRKHFGILNAASAKLSIDDTLEAISTSNLPTVKLQPIFAVQTRTTAARTGNIRRYEAYNT